MKSSRFSFIRTAHRLSFRNVHSVKEKKELVLALKKQEGQGMAVDNKEADANIDVLSLIHKSNVRFTLSHSRDQQNHNNGSINENDEQEREKLFAPQHRRYLTFPKVKQSGSLSKREQIDNRNRLDYAVSQAHKYQLEALGLVDQSAGHNSLTNYKGLNAIIEDKIQLSILQGDFDNLKGEGKDKSNEWVNPFVDRTQDLCFDILKKNGIKPEWIESQQNMSTLNNFLRALIRCRILDFMLTNIDARASSIPSELAHDLTSALSLEEGLCHHYTDLYNLQVPTYTLTRGRISVSYESSRIYSSLAQQQEGQDTTNAQWGETLKSMLEVAKGEIELNLHLVNRLHSERRTGGRDTTGDNRKAEQRATSHFSGPSRDISYSSKREEIGLSAGKLTMNFFMAPIDRLVGIFNRIL